MRKFLLLAMGVAMSFAAYADEPFRNHRYDSFKATPTVEDQIVFAGNSITNMHSWFEAFGSHQEVIGRGNSGGFAYELLDNLESYIDAKPSKLFVMIGTNDISSGQSAYITARRIETIVQRVRVESPQTEIYVESILPRRANAKDAYEQCNTLVRQWIAAQNDPKVHFVNLSEVCSKMGAGGRNDWNYDNLHPTVKGYTAWTHEVEDYVGYPSIYPANVVDDDYELSAIDGFSSVLLERAQQFEYYPTAQGDVWFFGDEQVHGGEWHELLRSAKIKDRGTLWGWGGLNLTDAKTEVTNTLNKQQQKPAKIFLFFGVGERDAEKYGEIIDAIKELAPATKIYCVALSPSTNAGTNTERVNFNIAMRPVAEAKGCTYVDVYTPLAENTAANIMNTNYISGRGYVVMANKLAEYLTEENVDPVTIEEYNATYARRTNRKIIGDALTVAYMSGYDVNGNLRAECPNLPTLIDQAVAAVNSADLTAERATEIATGINTYLNETVPPLTSGWYILRCADNGQEDYIVNADAYPENDGIFHNQYGCAPLVCDPDGMEENRAPQGWVYINVVGGNHQLQGINGWYIGDKSIGSRTVFNTPFTETGRFHHYILPGWGKIDLPGYKADHEGSLPIVGGSSSYNFVFSVTPVPEEEVRAYDIWTVNIIDANAGSTVESLYLDTRVTLDCPENHGITTVYNHGRFFLTPGTVLTEDMLTLHATAATSEITSPLVQVNNDTKTITIKNDNFPLRGKRTYYVPVTNANQLVHGGKYQIVNHNANWTSNYGADHYLKCTNGTVSWAANPNPAEMEDTYWTLEEDLEQNGVNVNTYPNRWYKLRHGDRYFNYMTNTGAESFSFIHRSLWPTSAQFGTNYNNMASTEVGDFFTMDYKEVNTYYTLGVKNDFAIAQGHFTHNETWPFTLPFYNDTWSFVHKLYQVVEVEYERVTDLSQINPDDRYVLVCHNINWADKAVTFNADGTRALTDITTVMADPRAALLQFEPVTGSNDVLVRNAGRYMRFLEGANYQSTIAAAATPVHDCYMHFNKTSLPTDYVTAADDVDGVYFEVLFRTDATTYKYSGTNTNGAFGTFSSNGNFYNNNTGHYSLYFQLYKVKLSANDAYTEAAETVLDALKVKNNIGDDPHQYALTTAAVPYLNNLQAIGDAATSDLTTSAITSAIDAAVAAYKDANATSIKGAVASPRAGMYLRIYNPDGDFTYALGSEANADHKLMGSSARDASTIFYFDGSHLINYATGYYIKEDTTPYMVYPSSAAENENPTTVKFVPSWYTGLADVYSVSFAGFDARCVHLSGANVVTNTGKFPSQQSGANFKPYAFRLEKITELPVSIHSDGCGSIIAPVALTLRPADDIFYYIGKVTENEDGTHTIATTLVESETTVPANTGIVIYAPDYTTVNVPIDYTCTDAIAADHEAPMHGHYITRTHSMIKRDNTACFVKTDRPAGAMATFSLSANPTATFACLNDDDDVVPANSMVIRLNSANVTPGSDLTVNLGAEQTPTSISEVTAERESDAYFDLQGRPVANPARGIFIHNGRKILVK